MHENRLSDLLDISIIQKMADAHYHAAGMPIGIIDAFDGSVLVGAGWQDICVKYHRNNPASLKRCRESDHYITKHLVPGEACHYKCKNGLWDIGFPIVVAGRHLATMFLGQFFYEGEEPDRNFFKEMAHEFGFHEERYLAALDRVPVFSREKVRYILEYDKALANFIADLAENALSKRKADEAVRESEQKFHAIFNQSFQFFGILSIDGRVLEANKTSLDHLDLNEQDIIGVPFWETPWWTHSPEFQETLRNAVQEGGTGKLVRFEATHPSNQGKILHVDVSVKPVKDDDGKVKLLIAEGRDISVLKESEKKIKTQAEFLQVLLDAMPYPVFYKDRQARYLGCNKAFEGFIGISREHLAGKTVYDIAPRELAEEYTRSDQALLSQPGKQAYESSLQTSSGQRYDVIFHKATFNAPDGKPAGIVGSIIDISERKQAEREKQKLQEQLLLTQKMESIGRLAGGVAHDFNNMLSVILGNAELSLLKMDSAHPLRPHLEEIRTAAEHSAELTRQLLAFARKQEVTPKEIDLNLAVGQMLAMLRRLVGEEIKLDWSPGHELWRIKIDPAQIDQILMNMTVNARDAIDGIGKIKMETRNLIADEPYCSLQVGLVPGDYVLMEITDNGCGMDRKTLDNIFEPFFTTKQEGTGTGLGLATVYGIVKQNCGIITAYSEPGKGTSFKIYFPRNKEKTALSKSTVAPITLPCGEETVLLVEDDVMLLKIVRVMLLKLGYKVLAASSPSESILLAREYDDDIHLLITDVIMPEMNGRELAGQLSDLYPRLKCLFMSGYTASVISSHGVLEKGIHFIQKPFSINTMASKLCEVLDRNDI